MSCDDSSSNSSTPDNIQQQQHQTKSNGDSCGSETIDRPDDALPTQQQPNDDDDDDDLDFDPISFSSRALEDMLRSSISDSNGLNGPLMAHDSGLNSREQSIFARIRSNGGAGGGSFGLNDPLSSNLPSNMNSNSMMNLLSRTQQQQQQMFNTQQFGSNFNQMQQNLSEMFQQKLMMNCGQQQQSLGSSSFGNGGQFLMSPNRTSNGSPQQTHLQQMFESQLRSQQQQQHQQQQQSQMMAFMNAGSSGANSGNQTNKLWQQNSLRQLLPNVNIKFQQQQNENSNGLGFGSSTSFFNGGPLSNNLMRLVYQFCMALF